MVCLKRIIQNNVQPIQSVKQTSQGLVRLFDARHISHTTFLTRMSLLMRSSSVKSWVSPFTTRAALFLTSASTSALNMTDEARFPLTYCETAASVTWSNSAPFFSHVQRRGA